MTTLAGFSPIAAALADPAREAMLAALVGGCALPAGELAMAAGLSPSGQVRICKNCATPASSRSSHKGSSDITA